MEAKSKSFLEYPEDYINYMRRHYRYDTCHRINGLDASKCARDCERLAHSTFAKQCEMEKGLFKCCIRYKNEPKSPW